MTGAKAQDRSSRGDLAASPASVPMDEAILLVWWAWAIFG